MGDSGFQLLDILLLGGIATFIALRLRAVLGQRTGHEQARRRPAPEAESPAESGDNVVHLPRPEDEAAAPAPHARLGPVLAADPGFDTPWFLEGAKAAYEMIVVAFANGDKATLKDLLSPEVMADFAQVIDARARKGEVQQTTFVGLKALDIVDSHMNGRVAEITVKFESELISVTRNGEGAVVAGDPSTINAVTDIWTFARDLRSRDPKWTLIGTGAPA